MSITIRPSKQWVLPPRPRPGRKPASHSAHHTDTPTSDNCKRERKQHTNKCNKSIETKLHIIKEENKMLKQELSTLVAQLKQLQQQQQSKKRNHLEMETEDSLLLYSSTSSPMDDLDDDVSSMTSTPSLMSSTSSLGSHSLLLSRSLSHLGSIQEEPSSEVLKIDEFLTTSYFDPTESKNETLESILKEKPLQMSPPGLPLSEGDVDIQFDFLKRESAGPVDLNVIGDNYDSLFDGVQLEDDFYGKW